MAIKDYINVFYTLENNNSFSLNTVNNFDIKINPQLDMAFTQVTCSLQYQVLGKTISNKINISSLTIDQNSSWEKNNNYNYKGKFELGDLPVSYNGKNLQIIWWLYLEVVFNQESKSRIQNMLLKDLFVVSLVKSFDGKHQNKNIVSVNNPNFAYEINAFDSKYKVDPYLYLTIGIITTIITSILFFSELFKKYILIPIIGSIGFTVYGLHRLYSIGLLKEIKFVGSILNNKTFNLEITIQNNHEKITSATVYYSIIEEIIDNRGTTSTTYRESIYRSAQTIIEKPPNKIINVQLDYPDKDLPIDFSRKNIRFYAQIEVTFNFKNNTISRIKQKLPLCKLK